MRRLLRKIAERQFEDLGDLTTLENPALLEQIIHEVKALPAH